MASDWCTRDRNVLTFSIRKGHAMSERQCDFGWVISSELAEAMSIGFRLAADELLASIPECEPEERLPTLKAVDWFETNADLLSEMMSRLASESK